MAKGRYLSIEQPDDTATIDFLSWSPEEGYRIAGAVVQLTLEYHPRNQEATLHVYVKDATDAAILLDSVLHLAVIDDEEDEEGDFHS